MRFPLRDDRVARRFRAVKQALVATFVALTLVLPLAHGKARADDVTHVSRANMPPGWQWPPTDGMRLSGERCLLALDQAGVNYRRKQHSVGKIATPVVVPSMNFAGLSVRQVYAKGAPVMDCHMALALAQQAPAVRALGIRELVVAGFYQNRRARLRGRSLPILSRHALGLAVDIRALVTEQGESLSVLKDYRHPVFARFEQVLSTGGLLRAVVTPGNDPAHRNHFHISARMPIAGHPADESVDVRTLLAQVRRPRGSQRTSSLAR